MEPMQSSFGHTFSGIFRLGTLAGLEGMLSSQTEPVFLQNQVMFTKNYALWRRLYLTSCLLHHLSIIF
jgi:hypothetical protein